MVGQKKKHLHWFSGIFEPTVDFYALLTTQADKTHEGMVALATWLREDGDARCQTVRDLERQADEMKMDLERKLVVSFVTPFDREDIYELSWTMDEVINSAKGVVREMEAMNVSPSGTRVLEMADMLVEGTLLMKTAIHSLKTDLREAAEQSLQLRKVDSRFGKIYRPAVNELFDLDDFKTIFRVKEVYRAMVVSADRIDRVGETLLHAIVKMS